MSSCRATNANRFESIRKRSERDPRDLRAAFALACYERALTDALYVDFDSYPSMLADSGCDLLEAGIGNREDDAPFWTSMLTVWRQMRDSGNYDVPESLKHQELRVRAELAARTVEYNAARREVFEAALLGKSTEYSVEDAEYVIARMDRESRNYAEVSAELEAQEAREKGV